MCHSETSIYYVHMVFLVCNFFFIQIFLLLLTDGPLHFSISVRKFFNYINENVTIFCLLFIELWIDTTDVCIVAFKFSFHFYRRHFNRISMLVGWCIFLTASGLNRRRLKICFVKPTIKSNSGNIKVKKFCFWKTCPYTS